LTLIFSSNLYADALRRSARLEFKFPGVRGRPARIQARKLHLGVLRRIKREVRIGLITPEQQSIWETVLEFFINLKVFPVVVPMGFSYDSQDEWGNKVNLTGAVIFPLDALQPKNPRSIPILALQHPTQVERAWSPSRCTMPPKLIQDPQKNVLLGAIMAAAGYIVVLPDYPGMGDTGQLCN
jgi:hypothetical protein